MQTFLPSPNFERSASVLDFRRLGKQRLEALQILQILVGEKTGFCHHPAVKMWAGHELSLYNYGKTICLEWIMRGYRDTRLEVFNAIRDRYLLNHRSENPCWMGDPYFHRAHRSNLLRKFPEHYRRFWPHLSDSLAYAWPRSHRPSVAQRASAEAPSQVRVATTGNAYTFDVDQLGERFREAVSNWQRMSEALRRAAPVAAAAPVAPIATLEDAWMEFSDRELRPMTTQWRVRA